MARRPKPPAPDDVHAGVARIQADERILWFPIRHYSAVCARHLRAAIEGIEPAAVLVEGPDDATPLIEHIVDPQTEPPLTIFSAYIDKKNRFEQNGIMSPSEDVPARFRSWWPMTAYCPEYVALVAGHTVGADLRFIDLPLSARIAFHHARQGRETEVSGDRHLATSAYFEALRKRGRRRSFGEFWEAHFEVGGVDLTPDAFARALLTFAWCTRHIDQSNDRLEADGTLLRESHMRWHIDQALKAHPEGRIVVVTGAFHSVVLPFIKGKRAKVKADRNLETLVTPHSFGALSRLYDMERQPAYRQMVWDAMEEGEPRPFDAVAMRLLVDLMRTARDRREAVSTADAVGAWRAAKNLAQLRGNAQVTLHDLLDAAQMGYVKADQRFAGPLNALTRQIMVGRRFGRVTDAAGQAPVVNDFYAQCRVHRLDLSGTQKTVRLDRHKQVKHRLKSAFLHQCDLLEMPMFGVLDKADGHFKGPDPVSRTDQHLITETWAVRWREEVDDRLIEIADRGASIALAAASLLRDRVAEAQENVAQAARLLLHCGRMVLPALFDEVLDAVESAIEQDGRFEHLADALADLVLTYTLRDDLATSGHGRLLQTIERIFNKAARSIGQIGRMDPDAETAVLDALQTVTRVALTFEATPLDREILIEHLHDLVDEDQTGPTIHGAGCGVLHGFGSLSAGAIAGRLERYLKGTTEHALDAGRFLDGLFQNARSVFLHSPQLLRSINAVVARLDWETFKQLLPDLRRAFTRFIPTEIYRIADRVGVEIGLNDAPDLDRPVPDELAMVAAAADARVLAVLNAL